MKKVAKKLFSSLFTSTLLLSPLASLAGEVDTATTDLGYFVSSENLGNNNTQTHLYKLKSNGEASIIISNIFPDSTYNGGAFSATDYTVSQKTGKIYFLEPPRQGISQRRIRVFDMETNAFEGFTNITNLPGSGSPMFVDIPVVMDNLVNKKCNTTEASCGATDSKFVSVGGADMEIKITEEGMTVGEDNLIKRQDDGTIHIGKNSLITTNEEKNGVQPLYATDAAGKRIPIDIQGSRLLINGRDVEQSINNVGALSAALTGLPNVPTETTLSCGVGTGTHGGDFALSGGCASKINENLSVNYAASVIMPGQEYAGDFEDSFSARAGFIWKLGKPVKPTLISMKEKKEFETQINTLEETNKQLLARLEKLEKVALGSIQSKDLASSKINFKSLNKELKKNDFK